MSSGHAGAVHRWRLRSAFALIAGFFGVELVVGLTSGSLALLSDAGHMAADVVALGAALVATRIAARPDRTGQRTYGSYRAEVFASGLAVLIMLGVAAFIAVEVAGRADAPAQVATGPVVVVGALGLLVNLVALRLLHGGAGESLNVKGAYLEVLADTLGSVGVLTAGVLVAVTGNASWDTGIALAIGAFVVVRAILLGREVMSVLAQHAPKGMVLSDVVAELGAVDGVVDVHDLHIWTLTSGMHVATAHLVTGDDADGHAVLDRAHEVMAERFGITHATLQIEPVSHQGCHQTSW